MSEPYETFEVNGYTVKLHEDSEPGAGNPRDADNLGVMLANGHRSYTLGDADFSKHIPEYGVGEQLLARLLEEHGGFRRRSGDSLTWDTVAQAFKEEIGATVVLPLWLLDHSGLAMRTGEFFEDPGQWDSGIVGVIYDTPRTRQICGTPLDQVEEALRGEVTEYDKYLQGDVWGYKIEDPNGEQGDSCWGFLGLEWCREEAREAAEHLPAPLREEDLTQSQLNALRDLVSTVASEEATSVVNNGKPLAWLIDKGVTTDVIRERINAQPDEQSRPSRTIAEFAEYGPTIPTGEPDIPGRLPYDDGTPPAGAILATEDEVKRND